MVKKALLNFVIAGLVLVPLIAGCDKTHQAPKSNFIGDRGVLGDYSLLQKLKVRQEPRSLSRIKGGESLFCQI